MIEQQVGRVPAEPGSKATPGAASVSALSGYDPSRFAGLAERVWDTQTAFSFFESELDDLTGEFDRLGHDYYDASLEIKGAANSIRLSEDAQRLIAAAGFAKVYVNHEDGWETHYTVNGSLPVRGWRRRYVSDETADTTNVIAGEPNPGYYEISYWPEGWNRREWLETGYMRIVPDALDPFAPRDRDASMAEDAKRLSPEGVAARAEGIAKDMSHD